MRVTEWQNPSVRGSSVAKKMESASTPSNTEANQYQSGARRRSRLLLGASWDHTSCEFFLSIEIDSCYSSGRHLSAIASNAVAVAGLAQNLYHAPKSARAAGHLCRRRLFDRLPGCF
jgi:hypothetical protein